MRTSEVGTRYLFFLHRNSKSSFASNIFEFRYLCCFEYRWALRASEKLLIRVDLLHVLHQVTFSLASVLTMMRAAEGAFVRMNPLNVPC